MKWLSKEKISYLAGAFVCLSACISLGSDNSCKVVDEQRVVAEDKGRQTITLNPEIPSSILFCGEKIDLTRYNMHESFDREITSFTYFHSTTLLLIKRANRYFPIIEPILKKNGIPDDFKYLAVIESHLDPQAVSSVHAVGMWQLMEGTAKDEGLIIQTTIDERRHVQKSTEAACNYLKKSYQKYGNWIDVAASYNAGMARISGEMQKQNSDSVFDLWLVEETSRYVFRMMAIKQIFEHPSKYGFVLKARDLYRPIRVRSVKVSMDIPDLADFAKEQGVTYADLKRFNTWLRDRKLVTGGRTYYLDIPEKEDLFYKAPNTVVHDPRWVTK
ncbi:MAG: lytic transglycosylase domain-containing protein [Massilibacteroides sp.]|nr:lytic transglycosylase domain-containing protein [Massilibacteroides sp.]MDD3061311.1 lytic transglycosylase domain-containing protein [Massilibacteroides sp.]MDD4115833.1 lytic transglycosylase domain-containing protein [Massilibacteroides sp.]MDD4659808.1 lytic transglycosylase domain-containing protein [Massilibacteroides sp.]